jgi:tRNA nucleotidyltransferase (CCA-adding enzyme)
MELRLQDPALREALDLLCRDVAAAGGRAILVGGSVRDALRGDEVGDLDVEVYHLAPDSLKAVLSKRFRLDLVGQSFGVLKLRGLPIDVAIPRRESKHGLGHKGFEIHSDPDLSFAEAASRRDFTINAIGFDLLSGELLDPWDGAADLERGILRHVSEKFSEDPLRVLRGMQFAARFLLVPAPETVSLCATIDTEGLAAERIFDEWKKLILLGREPSRGLHFLHACGWLRFFPELERLVGCPQDPVWHPEGDVFVHTGLVMDAFARERVGEEWEDLVVGFACLCHDFGKPVTTAFTEGRWRSPGHEESGVGPTRSFLGRMTRQQDLVEEVLPLVKEHMRPNMLFKEQASAAAIRRLARRAERIDRLVRVCRADSAGRPPLPAEFPAGDWLLAQAAALAVEKEAPKKIVLGRHLVELGLEPGIGFGPLIEACYEAQLDGVFSDLEGGIAFLREHLAKNASA